jgi:hypothetical protein
MATNTPNYNLVKAGDADYYNIGIHNDNMDKIDAALKPTADPSQVPSGLSGKIVEWVSWITNRIKAITGKTNWYDAPSKSLEDLNTHMSDYVRQPGYGVTGGTANAIEITLTPAPTAYTEGMGIAFKKSENNTGAVTINVNGLGAKPLLKSSGGEFAAGNLKNGSVYTARYNGINFRLQGEGGEYGTAGAAQTLSGYTIGTENGVIPGTMPNNGSAAAETVNLTSEGQEYTIAAGYHSGLRKIKAVITGLVAGVVKAGTTVGGILGTFTNDATATAAQMLSGATAWVKGVLVTGNIPSKGAATITPGTTNQTIAAGQYLSGNQLIVSLGGDAAASEVRSDATFSSNTAGRGIAGTMPVNGSQTSTLQITGSAKPTKAVPAGYTPGGTITAELAAALATSIISGATIGGVAGTNTNKKWASGTVTSSEGTINFQNKDESSALSSYSVTVTGLTFQPSRIYIYRPLGGVSNTIYDSIVLPDATYPKFKIMNDIGGQTWMHAEDGYYAYVNATSFRLPVGYNSTNYFWIAIE